MSNKSSFIDHYVYVLRVYFENQKPKHKTIRLILPRTESHREMTEIVRAETGGVYISTKNFMKCRYVNKQFALWPLLTEEQKKICEKARDEYAIKKCEERGIPTEVCPDVARLEREERELGEVIDAWLKKHDLAY